MTAYETTVPVVPDSWYHVCIGLDSGSGLFRIIINGKVIENEEKEFFKGTESIKPNSVAGKFLGNIFLVSGQRFYFKKKI